MQARHERTYYKSHEHCAHKSLARGPCSQRPMRTTPQASRLPRFCCLTARQDTHGRSHPKGVAASLALQTCTNGRTPVQGVAARASAKLTGGWEWEPTTPSRGR